MQVIQTGLIDCVVIVPKVFSDERGFFLETFHAQRYGQMLGITMPFVQDNHSRSSMGVLRGIHFQKRNPQGKLVRVVQGEVFDVAVDLRRQSSTFGQWFGVILSGENKKQMWLPPGFGHGFVVLSDVADFEYKCTDFYDPADEYAIAWNDPDLAIEWPRLTVPYLLSAKDQQAAAFSEYAQWL